VALSFLVLSSATRELRAAEPVPQLEWTLNEYQAVNEPLPEAATEAQWTCEPAPGVPLAPIGRLRIERKLRFWASAGPRPQQDGARALLSVRALVGGVHGSLLACGSELGLDLEPGEYAIYGSERLTRSMSYDAIRLGAGFVYRVGEPGNRQCPKALAAFGISDWDGEFPFEVVTTNDLNGDGRRDVAVHYQAAATNRGTRLLVTEAYPRCLRTVLDAGDEVAVGDAPKGSMAPVVYHYSDHSSHLSVGV
jgi:hypothetical protein